MRDSESMQRAVWRKNPDTFYVAIEKKSCPLGKKLPKRLEIYAFGTERTEAALSDLKVLKMTAMRPLA